MEVLLTGAMFRLNSSGGSGVANKFRSEGVYSPLYVRRVKNTLCNKRLKQIFPGIAII